MDLVVDWLPLPHNQPNQNMVQQSGDCVDNNANIHPNATEVCDLVDNDCDNQIDDGDSSLNTSSGTAFYLDGDGDGFGANGSLVMAVWPQVETIRQPVAIAMIKIIKSIPI